MRVPRPDSNAELRRLRGRLRGMALIASSMGITVLRALDSAAAARPGAVDLTDPVPTRRVVMHVRRRTPTCRTSAHRRRHGGRRQSHLTTPNYYLTAAQIPRAGYLGRRRVVLGGETGRSS